MIKRCQYCRPRWTYGLTPYSILGRIVALLWPPHVYGGNGTGEFTDGLCPKAAQRENAELDRLDLAKWLARWKRWRAYADSQNTIKNRVCWILDYQYARRREMEGGL